MVAPQPNPPAAVPVQPEKASRGPRLAASGAAVMLHVGLAGLLLHALAIPPSPAAPEEVPVTLALAEPVEEEAPAPAEALSEQAAAPVEETPPAPQPPDPARSEPAPPEPQPPKPQEVVESPLVPSPPEAEAAPLPEPPPPPPEPPPLAAARPRPAVPRAPTRPAGSVPSAVPAVPAAAPPAPAVQAVGPPPSYLQSLAAALERQKRYPEAARARRATGVALLQFTVLRDGRVAQWRIARSSGDPDLDRAVGEMIERARLPAMPGGMQGESLAITVPVRFRIR